MTMLIGEAREIAQDLVTLFRPYCHRCEIASSIRREKLEPKGLAR